MRNLMGTARSVVNTSRSLMRRAKGIPTGMGPLGVGGIAVLGAMGAISAVAGQGTNTYAEAFQSVSEVLHGFMFRDPYADLRSNEGQVFTPQLTGTVNGQGGNFNLNVGGDPLKSIRITSSDIIAPDVSQGRLYREAKQEEANNVLLIPTAIAGGIGGVGTAYVLDQISTRVFEKGVRRTEAGGYDYVQDIHTKRITPLFKNNAAGYFSSIFEEGMLEEGRSGITRYPRLGKNFTPIIGGAMVGAAYGGAPGAVLGASVGSYLAFLGMKEEIGPKVGKRLGSFLVGAATAALIFQDRRQEAVQMTGSGSGQSTIQPRIGFSRPDIHRAVDPYALSSHRDAPGVSPLILNTPNPTHYNYVGRVNQEYLSSLDGKVNGNLPPIVVPNYGADPTYSIQTPPTITPAQTGYLDHVNPFFFAGQVAFGASMALLAAQQVAKVTGSKRLAFLGALSDYENKVETWRQQAALVKPMRDLARDVVSGNFGGTVRNSRRIASGMASIFHHDVVLNKGKEVVSLGAIAVASYTWINNYQRNRSDEIAGASFAVPSDPNYRRARGHADAGITIFQGGPPPGMDPQVAASIKRNIDSSRYLFEGHATRFGQGNIFYDSGMVGDGFMNFLHSARPNSLRGAFYEINTDREFMELIDSKAMDEGITVSMGGNVNLDYVDASKGIWRAIPLLARPGNYGAMYGEAVNSIARFAGIEAPYSYIDQPIQGTSTGGIVANMAAWGLIGGVVGAPLAARFGIKGGFLLGAGIGAMFGATQPTYIDPSAYAHLGLATQRIAEMGPSFIQAYATNGGDPMVDRIGGAAIGIGAGALAGYVMGRGKGLGRWMGTAAVIGGVVGAIAGLSGIGQYTMAGGVNIRDKVKPVLIGERYNQDDLYVLHSKTIASAREGFVSTANVGALLDNARGRENQINFGMWVRDPSIVGQINKALDFIEGIKPESNLSSISDLPNVILGGEGARSVERIVEHIRGTEGPIFMTQSYMTSPAVVQALVDAEAEGRQVVLLAQNPLGVKGGGARDRSTEAIRRLVEAGVDVYMTRESSNVLQHSKAIFTPDTAFVTSHNFSNASDRGAVEIGVLVEDVIAGRAGIQAVLRAIEKFQFQNITQNAEGFENVLGNTLVAKRLSNMGITDNVASIYTNAEAGTLISTNLGASYFYGRALFNTRMRQAGHHHLVGDHRDASIASSLYKTSYLVATGSNASSIPQVFRDYDRQLQTPGLGALFNEYIAMPLGWGRLYKDEVGLIPSLLGSFGAALDRSYLYYSGGRTMPGIDTMFQPMTTASNFYQENRDGFFESLFTFSADFGITTASAVALYMTVGEPLNLIVGEAMRQNVQASIDAALPMDPEEFRSRNARLNRWAAFGTGVDAADPLAFKRSLILSVYDSQRRKGSFYDIDNFALTPYHLNTALFRRKAEMLLGGIMKPFLMNVVNPYMDGEDNEYRKSIDNLVREIGSPTELRISYAAGTSQDVIEFITKVRKAHTKEITTLYKERDDIIRRLEESKATGAYVGEDHYKVLSDIEQKIKSTTLDKYFDYAFGRDVEASLLLSDNLSKLERRPEVEQVFISNAQIYVSNAGEERSIRVAQALQGVLEQIPLNPFQWRIFSAFNGGGFRASSEGMRPYRAVGDIFSFEDATNAMRNVIFGTGGVQSLLAKHTVVSGVRDRKGNPVPGTKHVLDRLHSFWNLLTAAPGEALTSLVKRSKMIDALGKSTRAFKRMEENLYKKDPKYITFANSADSIAMRTHIQGLRSDAESLADARGLVGVHRERFVERYISSNVSSSMDPFSREIGEINAEFYAAIDTLQNQTDELNKAKISGNQVLSSRSTKFRKSALGVMSLMSRSTFEKRVTRLDPGSKITKGNIGTYVAVTLASSFFLDSLFKSSQGVSLWQQLRTALVAGNAPIVGGNDANQDLGFNVEFSGGSLFGGGGPWSRLAISLGGSGIAFSIARWTARAMQDVEGISYTLREDVIKQALKGGAELTHVSTNTTITGSTLQALDELGSGQYKLTHQIAGRNIEIMLSREISDIATESGERIARSSLFKFNITRLSGNVVRNTAVIFGALSLAGTMGTQAAAWAMNRSREASGGLDPILFGLMGGGIGAFTTRKFGGGLAGVMLGGLVGLVSGKTWNGGLTSVGKAGPTLDPINTQIATELNTFKSLIRERGLDRASRAELMAAVYADQYAKVLNLNFDSGGRTTQVIAKQSPLPFLQFFLAESITNQRVDREGRITDQGRRYFTVGIQSAPMLGMSISVGLPFKLVYGGGVPIGINGMGISHNEKSNLIDIMGGLQVAAGSMALGLGASKAIASTVGLIPRWMGKNWELGAGRGYLDGLTKVSNTVVDIGVELLATTPLRVTQWMFGSDAILYSKTIPQLFKSKDLGADPTIASKREGRVAASLVARAFGAAVIGSIVGGIVGALSSPEGSDLDSNISTGRTVGAFAGVGAYGAYLGGAAILSNHSLTLANYKGRVGRAIGRVSNNLLKLSPITTKIGATLSSPLVRRVGGPLLLAAGVGTLLTDSRYGLTTGMDDNGWVRGATVLAYAGIMGAVYHKFGGMGYSHAETFDRFIKIEEAKTKLSNKKGPEIIKRVQNWALDMWGRGVQEDMDVILKGVTHNQEQIARLAEVDPQRFGALKTLSDNITAKNITKASDVTKALPATSDIKSMRGLLQNASGSYLNSRTFPKLFARRGLWRPGLAMTTGTLVVQALLGAGGAGSGFIDGVYRALDRTGAADSAVGNIADTLGNVLRLITWTDASIEDPRTLTQVFRDRGNNGMPPQMVTSMKLSNPRNNMYRGLERTWRDIRRMFVLDPANPFINLASPVGFTFRSGEYGTRVSSYIQFQAPGADISTAVYSMSSAFMFKEVLTGKMDNLMLLRSAFREMNASMAIGHKADSATLRYMSRQILSLSAMVQPLTKRRKFSGLDQSTLELISGDPLLSKVVSYRQNLSRSAAHQPVASLMSRMLLESMDNNMVSSNIIMKAMLSGKPGAMKALFDDPFGLISRNIAITDVRMYSRDYSKRDPNAMKSEHQYFYDESDWHQYTSSQLDVHRQSQENGLLNAVGSAMSGIWNGLENVAPGPIKWFLLLGVGGFTAVSLINILGDAARSKQHDELMSHAEGFFNDKWYNIEEVVGKDGKTYYRTPWRSSTIKAPGGSSVKVMGRERMLIHKGASYFEINQSLGEHMSTKDFQKKLDDSLRRMQVNINRAHMEFVQEDLSDGKVYRTLYYALTEGTDDKYNATKWVSGVEKSIHAGEAKAKIVQELKEKYKVVFKEYIDRYFTALEETKIKIKPNLIQGVDEISLIALFSDPSSPLEDIGNIKSVDELFSKLQHLGGNSPFTYGGKIMNNLRDRYLEEVMDTIEAVLTREIKGRGSLFGGVVLDDFLGSGSSLTPEAAMRYLTDKVILEISETPSSPLYMMRHNLGGLVTSPSQDVVTKISQSLENISRNIKSFMSSDPDENHIRRFTRSIVGAKTKASAPFTKPAADVSLDVSEEASSRVSARFGGKASSIGKGLSTGAELVGFAIDILESVDAFSAYARLGGTYGEGVYTEAQRLNAANEAGMITVNTVMSMGIGALVMNIGTITAGVGAGLAKTAGLGVVGAGAGASIALGTKGILGTGLAAGGMISAAVAGGAVLAAAAVIGAIGWFTMPEKWRKGVTDTVGKIWEGASRGIGTGLKGIGDGLAAIGGSRLASAGLMGIGGILSGAVIGLGLGAVSLLSLPALATIGLGAAVGGALGLASGLLFPGFTKNLSNTVTNTLSQIPILNMFANPAGSWLNIMGEDLGMDSPFLSGTASQAIDYEYSKVIQAATDYTGSSSARLYTSASIYGESTSRGALQSKMEGVMGRIRPDSLVDPMIDREIRSRAQTFNQTIIGRHLWRSMERSSTRRRVVERTDREFAARQANAEAQRVMEESKKVNASTIPARYDNGDILPRMIAKYAPEAINARVRESQAQTQALNVRIDRGKLPSTAPINQTIDIGLVPKNVALSNQPIVANGNQVTTRVSISEQSEYANLAVNTTATTHD